MKNDMDTIILIIPAILFTFTIIYMINLLVSTFTTKNKIDR